MPTYQYACTACEHRFDAVQSFTDPALTECPECAGRLRKLYGSVGVVFKGSGFYRTDSRSGAKAAAENGSAAAKEADSHRSAAAKEAGSNGSAAAKEARSTSSEKSTASSGSTGSSSKESSSSSSTTGTTTPAAKAS